MRIGLVVDGTDHFLHPIESALRESHAVERFSPRFVQLPLIGRRVNDQLLRWQLARFIKRNDVVFFEWAGTLLNRASHLPKQGKIITRLHSVELATEADTINWETVDDVIVLNESIKERLSSFFTKDSPPTIHVIANGIDLARYKLQSRNFNFRIGMVCNLLPIKRVYEVILTVYQLRQKGLPFVLKVAGSPWEGEWKRYYWAMRSLTQKLGLQEYVTFAGYVEDIPDWLASVDIFISNSYWEGQPFSLLEAMASGCYCLGHCWDGVEEILPLENIFVTDSELQYKICDYVAQPEYQRQIAQRRMRTIVEEKFDERRMVADIVTLIEDAGS